MARPNPRLISALRRTAARLDTGARYQWSHYGHCNCGNLAQTVTDKTPEELYSAAFERAGDWGEQAREFCPASGYAMDDVLARLFELGLRREDVRHLERLSDDRVLRRLGVPSLDYTRRGDVTAYMRAWADDLEELLAPPGIPLAAE